MSSPFNIKWGIFNTGNISESFVQDLLLYPPHTRGVTDVTHTVVAIGSGTSKAKAQALIDTTIATGDAKNVDVRDQLKNVKTYGSYEEVVKDENVDVVYISTPNALHYSCCLLALNNNKHVLLEKPFTANTAQAVHLSILAKQKNLFLMEAVWTKFFPQVLDLQKRLFEDRAIGKIRRISADLSRFAATDLTHKKYMPSLAGGTLLNQGMYALTWAFLFGYRDPENQHQLPIVRSIAVKNPQVDVDQSVGVFLVFPGSNTLCVATSSMDITTASGHSVLIEGDRGFVEIPRSANRPEYYKITIDGKTETVNFDVPGYGFYLEADSTARCIRDKIIDNPLCPLKETIELTSVMDQVRQQNGIRFPTDVEDLIY
ncbi:hypothetical protein AWJ20_2543 [Sugiyamaella lignohabitans]|uniref:D-xylose 1-dehydrogenase (NADP(+), D-xylono-1,5-lactone-forming) n=1 Tax=Sugiyamaella lignohabitans TaxID=796027 RepID=A0A167F7W5_9ASCO|nr:uncharacterized protein AWJ20_2543 [Sugiyamaella lignohabitans]ANB14926.1 hypothetical protein AWJ20_2543 [Sugiyamaella lignohabitans]